MTATAVTWAAPGSPEWLTARRGGVGGSDIAVLLGLNPWRTPVDLWRDKHGHDDGGFAGNYATARGTHMEPFVLGHYADQHPGAILDRPGDFPTVLAHPGHPAARVSLDALAHDRGDTRVVEAKAVGRRAASMWDEGVPDVYIAQASYQLAVTGLDLATVVADVAGDYVEFDIERDEPFCTWVLEMVDDWWGVHVDGGDMPDPDPVRDAPKLARLWTPDPEREPVALTHGLSIRLRDAKAAAAAAKADYDEAAALVQIAMGEATAAVDPYGVPVATWGPVKPRTTVDVAAMKAAGVYEDFARTGEAGRMFRVAMTKE